MAQKTPKKSKRPNQNAAPKSSTEDPAWLVARPDNLPPSPPIKDAVNNLPLLVIRWENFERLCRRLAEREGDVEKAWAYRGPRHAQFGIDVLVRMRDGSFEAWQSKRHKSFGMTDVKNAVDYFLNHAWARRAKRFVLALACEIIDPKVIEQIEASKTQLARRGIAFEAIGCSVARPAPLASGQSDRACRRSCPPPLRHLDQLYRLFLDDQMQYSCAYFRDPEHETLEQAQRNKLIHATSKLQLKPGMTIAEIGSGWGGFAIHLARETGAHVTAVNVSPEQIKTARVHAEAAGVSDRVTFRELDYRQLTGQFDRVVSVGMMEHVGIGHFDEYFLKIRELLTPDGYAFIHCIGRMSQPGTTGPFIRKYIFPGAYVPALSETFAATELVRRHGSATAALSLYGATLARALREE
jgi:cyclopropane fatty-acyl-phospholipid synthase-like methyltransferase